MFQFPGFPPHEVCVPRWGDGSSAAGFAHSETPGSKAVCASPGTIAACRVLRRLPAPRHPPCARDTFPRPSRGAGATVIPCMNSLAHDVIWIRTYRRPRVGAARSDATPRMISVISISLSHVGHIDGESLLLSSRAFPPGASIALCGSQGTRGEPRGPGTAGRMGGGQACSGRFAPGCTSLQGCVFWSVFLEDASP